MDDWWQQCKASVEDYRKSSPQPLTPLEELRERNRKAEEEYYDRAWEHIKNISAEKTFKSFQF